MDGQRSRCRSRICGCKFTEFAQWKCVHSWDSLTSHSVCPQSVSHWLWILMVVILGGEGGSGCGSTYNVPRLFMNEREVNDSPLICCTRAVSVHDPTRDPETRHYLTHNINYKYPNEWLQCWPNTSHLPKSIDTVHQCPVHSSDHCPWQLTSFVQRLLHLFHWLTFNNSGGVSKWW